MKRECDTCTHSKLDFDEMPCCACNCCDRWEAMTNADHIRSMTDEELSVFLHTSFSCYGCPARIVCGSADLDCDDIVFDWLKQPFDGGA